MPTSPKTAATLVLQALTYADHEAYLVGGCVRDTLLGLKPKDWDVTTSATKEQVMELFEGKAKLVGAHFGVVLVDALGHDVECATFRADGDYSDNRRPDTVTFTRNVKEDVLRRDFTVNALLMDADGSTYDFVHGKLDLQLKVLRTVGDPFARFSEDALRLLRAVRFACKLGFTVEENTFKAMRALAHTVKTVSAERVATELTGVLTSGNAKYGVQLLHDAGLLQHLLPEVEAMLGVEQK